MRITFSGNPRRPARSRRAIALALVSLVLAGLGTPAASADGGPTAVDRFFITQDGGSVLPLLIGQDVTGDSATFAVSGTTDGGDLSLVGGAECHSGTCTQWATYYPPLNVPTSGQDGFTYTVTDSVGTSAPAHVGISYLDGIPRPDDALARVSAKGVHTIQFRA